MTHTAPEPITPPVLLRSVDPALRDGRKEVVFIDAALADLQTLIDGVPAGVEIRLIDARQDGFAQMALWAENHSGYDAIHVLSHGAEARKQLGSAVLTAENLNEYASLLERIGQSLTDQGDMLLYGCNVAQGQAGRTFIEDVARLTQADVAASDDAAGATDRGGDWVLEYTSGAIGTETLAITGYTKTLASVAVTMSVSPGNGTSFGDMLTDGEGGIADVPGVTYQVFFSGDGTTAIGTLEYWTDHGTGALVPVGGNDPNMLVIRTQGEEEFKLTSLYVVDWYATTFQAVAYKGGETVGLPQTFTVPQSGLYATTITFGSQFQNVDEVRISPLSGYINPIGHAFNNFVIDDPVVPGPTFTSGATASFNENAVGTVYTAAATASAGSVSYSLVAGDDAALFSVNASTGAVTFNSPPDFESPADGGADNVYNVAIRATDDNGSTDRAVAITVNNVNEAPTDISLSSISVNQSGGVNASVGTFTATDPDIAPVFTYSLVSGAGDTHNALFNISGNMLRANDSSAMAPGTYSVRVQVSDGAGGTYTESYTVTVVDDVAPSTPAPPDLEDWADSGFSDSDDVTNDTAPTFSGTAEANATVYIYIDGVEVGSVAADGTGNWTFTAGPLTAGTFSVTATAMDAAGNESVVSAGVTVTIDTTGPGAVTGTLAVNENAANATTVGTAAAVGAVSFALTDNAGGRFAIDPVTGTVTVADGALLDFETGASHDITVEATDVAGNTTETTLTVTLNDVNEAPTLDLNGGAGGVDNTATLAIGGSPVAIVVGGALLQDVDAGDQMNGLTVEIDVISDSGDEVLMLDSAATLAATNAGLVVNYNGATGVLTVTGAASASVYQTILRGIQYENTSTTVDASTGDRVLTVTIDDGEFTASAASTVSVVTAPIVDLNGGSAGTGSTATFTEGDTSVAVSPDVTIADPDGDYIQQVVITLTNPQDGGAESIFLESIANGDIILGVTVTYTSATTITLIGAASGAVYEALVAQLQYANTSDGPETDTDREITVVATDVNGNAGPAGTAVVTVANVNDAPSLDDLTPSLGTTDEDTATILTVADFLGSVTDPDGGAEPTGIAITGFTGNGTWGYSVDGMTWNTLGSVSDAAAVLLASTDQLRYTPDGEDAETATLTYRAWDQSSRTAGDTTNVSLNGGTTAFSSNTATASLSVTAVNDAPTLPLGGSISASTNENTVVQGAGDTLASDVDPTTNKSIAVTALSGSGAWQYYAGAGVWNDIVTVSQSQALLLWDLADLRYIPDGENGEIATVTYHAWDRSAGVLRTKVDMNAFGGTGGSTPFSVNTNTYVINVAAVNDAPALADTAPLIGVTGEQTAMTLAVGDFIGTVIDPDSGALAGIAITSFTGLGDWAYSLDGGASWLDVPAGTSQSAAHLVRATDLIRYTPDGATAEIATIEYRAWDQTLGSAGGAADVSVNGGATAFSAAIATATLEVQNINYTPTSMSTAEQVGYNSTYTFTVDDFVFNDPDPGDSLQYITIRTLPGAGMLKLNGLPITAINTAVGFPALSAGQFQFVPANGGSGSAYASFDFTVNDGNADSSVVYTVTLNVANPPPPAPTPTPPPTPVLPPEEDWSQLPDDDGDGVPEVVESFVPSLAPADGSPPVAGDGNGDGIADREQADVASIPFRNTQEVSQNPDAPVVFVTLVAGANQGVPDGQGSITSAQQLDAPPVGDAPGQRPADLDLPLGLISFTATTTTPEAPKPFSLFVAGDLQVNGYWKPTSTGWVNLASPEYGGQTVTVGDKTRLDFIIVDNGPFDSDPTPGQITDPGGPGFMLLAPPPSADCPYDPFRPDADRDGMPDSIELQLGTDLSVKDNDVFTHNELFVRQLYRDLLGREGDAPGIAQWHAQLDQGGNRAELITQFMTSTEFESHAGAVARLYHAVLGRSADYCGFNYWVGECLDGLSAQDMGAAFLQSAEFLTSNPTLSDAGFIELLYQNVLGRAADAEGARYWLDLLAQGGSRGEVLYGFAQSDEYKQATADEVAIDLLYLGLLDRAPDQPGWDYWHACWTEFDSVAEFYHTALQTPEYVQRFTTETAPEAVELVGLGASVTG